MSHRECIGWPQGEAIPQSFEEAMALGWQPTGGESDFSDDERIEIGRVRFTKNVGNVELSFNLPYRAERAYGKAVDHQAWFQTINGEGVHDHWARVMKGGHGPVN